MCQRMFADKLRTSIHHIDAVRDLLSNSRESKFPGDWFIGMVQKIFCASISYPGNIVTNNRGTVWPTDIII